MRIGLNMLFVTPSLAGGGVYCDGLLRGLDAVDRANDYVVYTRQGVRLPPLDPDRFRHVVAPVAPHSAAWRTAWEYGLLPRAARRDGCRLLHGLGSLSPAFRTGPFVLTVHDLIYRHFPQSVPHGYREFMRLVHPRVAPRADRVIVPSASTARDAVAMLGVREDRLRTVAYGPGNDLAPCTDAGLIERTLAKHGVRRPYVISVARGYAHKNLAGLVRALAELKAGGPDDVRLVLVGDAHQTGPEIARLAQQRKVQDAVVFTGFVSRDELAALYSGAAVFAFPSLAEGFGLPLLEAMACGVPVVASDASAVPEAVGTAGVLADARDPGAFAAALRQVLDNAGLQAELRAKGLARVREFSWEKAARETVAVYRELGAD